MQFNKEEIDLRDLLIPLTNLDDSNKVELLNAMPLDSGKKLLKMYNRYIRYKSYGLEIIFNQLTGRFEYADR